ncbi:S1C family serine protease [Microvirga lotononidis]|uniref:Trypsin-like serine protease with C-terminal PDZ domain n=1 Tax=Microvirga lotononidis TaxID=864069 RepID=I4YVY0_9HYPH|nr:S1C family serine protease [Microvirga lotononidis]EIM28122.1 trypsin-like serine protease with C-terminal PDZ domain [Microvirga lotononidis]WQO27773.1 S1C family serine protease [Microvirga lotononidis]
MQSPDEWEIPPEYQPDPRSLGYDLKDALAAVVSLRARVPDDAFTAETLGTERAGQGVVIRDDGLVLTIGYLIAEAEEVWLTTNKGRAVQADVLAYDYESGFGLVQALEPLGVPVLALGDSRHLKPGDHVVIGGSGGLSHSLAAQVVACQEFAGYWEYLIDPAIFTAPAHPNWGGTALIGPRGDLVGIGSLQLQHQASGGTVVPLNMSVPIDLLKPILDDLLTLGRTKSKPRPWLGFYVAEAEDDQITVIGLAGDAPAQRAGLRAGDQIHAVAGQTVTSLAEFYRAVWDLGAAGVDVPLTLEREGDMFDVTIRSADRGRFMKGPRLQ